MTNEALDTSKDQPKRTSVAFTFMEKALKKEKRNAVKQETAPKSSPHPPKSTRPQADTKQPKVDARNYHTRPRYNTLSTQAYEDVRMALKNLAHERGMSGHEIHTIKAFIENALVEFFSKQQGGTREDAAEESRRPNRCKLVTLNNQIREDLLRVLKTTCHQRWTIGSSSHSIIRVLDEALRTWLRCQPEVKNGKVKFSG